MGQNISNSVEIDLILRIGTLKHANRIPLSRKQVPLILYSGTRCSVTT